MSLTLLNLTQEDIPCYVNSKRSSDLEITLRSSCPSLTLDLSDIGKSVTLLHRTSPQSSKENASVSTDWSVKSNEVVIQLSLDRSVGWRMIPLHDECPWRVYLSRVTTAHIRLYIIPRRDLSSFLSDMPDTLPLSSLCLPGTHDTMALYGWPVSQCQELSTPLDTQLRSGIRVLDIRLSIIESRLIAYHGLYPQRTSFQEILSIIHKFLSDSLSCHETIVMSIKQEDFMKNSLLEFSRLVHQEIFNGPGGREMWYLKNRIPTLGEVRGKIVMFSRFGGNGEGWEGGWEGLGIHPLNWPDSKKSGFTWQCKDTLVRTHDWYLLPSFLEIPEKFALASEILKAPPSGSPTPTLSISFLSAASFPLSLPPVIAKGFGWPKVGLGIEGINSRFVQWLLNNFSEDSENNASGSLFDEKRVAESHRIRGWALLDFYDEPGSALTPLLVECNYLGRQKGEEGW